MSGDPRETERRGRIGRLRDAWRRREGDSGRESADEQPDHQRAETLASNDRIRGEEPDDLETRRRADQLEREIKRSDPTSPDDG